MSVLTIGDRGEFAQKTEKRLTPDATMLALKMGEGAGSQGLQGTELWKPEKASRGILP